ncbi:aromatic amino acid transport family protein [Parendozoicomonas haliclonae]
MPKSSLFYSSPLLGATMIVAGTTIGAGMLALPIISYGLGFPLLIALLLLCWVFMAFAATLTLDVNLATGTGNSLFVMARKTLGRPGRFICLLATSFLFYALLAAYIAGGGEQIAAYISAYSYTANHSPGFFSTSGWAMCLFVLIFGTIASIGAHNVDACNRLLFFCMLATFLISLVLLAPDVQLSNLYGGALNKGNPYEGSAEDHTLVAALAVLPVIFTSFGYHGSIPSLIAYANANRPQLQKVFIFGSLLPLVLYLLWLGVTLGQLDNETLAIIAREGSVASLIEQLVNLQPNDTLPISSVIHIFTNLALVTSFLGVGLGFFDFIHSVIGSHSRALTAVAVFTPPLLIALYLPGAFVTALSFAALALAVLAILLPAAMALKLRKEGKIKALPAGLWFWPTVSFGILIVVLSLIYS